MKTVKPVGHRVLIKVDKPETEEKKTASGIIMQLARHDKDTLEMHTDTGVILELGPKVDEGFLNGAKIGDRVVFSRYDGVAKKYDDELVRVINDESIWAIIED